MPYGAAAGLADVGIEDQVGQCTDALAGPAEGVPQGQTLAGNAIRNSDDVSNKRFAFLMLNTII